MKDPIVERAKRINKTWITHGTLAEDTDHYLKHLEKTRPEEIPIVCKRAVDAARHASAHVQDPKPPFYASIFSTATKEERDVFLKHHFFTRLLSTEYQLADESPREKSD